MTDLIAAGNRAKLINSSYAYALPVKGAHTGLMPKLFTRIVCLLLVPGLLADHAIVALPSRRITALALFSVEALASRALNVGPHPAETIDEYWMANALEMTPSSEKLLWMARHDRRHQHPEREIRPPRQFRTSQQYYESKRSRNGRGKRSSRPGIPYKAGYNHGIYPHQLVHAANQIDFGAYETFVRERPEYSVYAEKPENELESVILEGSRFQRGMLDRPQFTDRKVGTMARQSQSKQKGSRRSADKQVMTRPAEVIRTLLILGYAFEAIIHSLHLDATKTDNIVGGSDFYIGKSDWENLNRLAAKTTSNSKHPTRQLLVKDDIWDQLPLQVHAALSGMPDNLYDMTDPEVLQANDINQYRWKSTPYWMKLYFACSSAHTVYRSRLARKRRNSQDKATSEPNGSDLNMQRFVKLMCSLIPNAKEAEVWTIWEHAGDRLALLQRFAELVKGRVPTIQDLKLAAESPVQKLDTSRNRITNATRGDRPLPTWGTWQPVESGDWNLIVETTGVQGRGVMARWHPGSGRYEIESGGLPTDGAPRRPQKIDPLRARAWKISNKMEPQTAASSYVKDAFEALRKVALRGLWGELDTALISLKIANEDATGTFGTDVRQWLSEISELLKDYESRKQAESRAKAAGQKTPQIPHTSQMGMPAGLPLSAAGQLSRSAPIPPASVDRSPVPESRSPQPPAHEPTLSEEMDVRKAILAILPPVTAPGAVTQPGDKLSEEQIITGIILQIGDYFSGPRTREADRRELALQEALNLMSAALKSDSAEKRRRLKEAAAKLSGVVSDGRWPAAAQWVEQLESIGVGLKSTPTDAPPEKSTVRDAISLIRQVNNSMRSNYGSVSDAVFSGMGLDAVTGRLDRWIEQRRKADTQQQILSDIVARLEDRLAHFRKVLPERVEGPLSEAISILRSHQQVAKLSEQFAENEYASIKHIAHEAGINDRKPLRQVYLFQLRYADAVRLLHENQQMPLEQAEEAIDKVLALRIPEMVLPEERKEAMASILSQAIFMLIGRIGYDRAMNNVDAVTRIFAVIARQATNASQAVSDLMVVGFDDNTAGRLAKDALDRFSPDAIRYRTALNTVAHVMKSLREVSTYGTPDNEGMISLALARLESFRRNDGRTQDDLTAAIDAIRNAEGLLPKDAFDYTNKHMSLGNAVIYLRRVRNDLFESAAPHAAPPAEPGPSALSRNSAPGRMFDFISWLMSEIESLNPSPERDALLTQCEKFMEFIRIDWASQVDWEQYGLPLARHYLYLFLYPGRQAEAAFAACYDKIMSRLLADHEEVIGADGRSWQNISGEDGKELNGIIPEMISFLTRTILSHKGRSTESYRTMLPILVEAGRQFWLDHAHRIYLQSRSRRAA